MLNSEILMQFQAELTLAVQKRCPATSPEAAPLDISIWLAMSLLQKSIRRGEVAFALQAAATLLLADPDRFWRRLICAAYEDIGLGDVDAIALVLGAVSGKIFRKSIGEDWPIACLLVERLALSRKCRAADDLLMVLQAHPGFTGERKAFADQSLPELLETATGQADIVARGIALSYALGTDRWRPVGLQSRRGEPTIVFQRLLDANFPHCVLELAQTGFNRVREPLSALMSLASQECLYPCQVPEKDDEVPASAMIGLIPGWAIDQYSRNGKEVLRKFMLRDLPITRFLTNSVRPSQRLAFLGGLVFRAEGGVLKKRLQSGVGVALRHQMEIEANGCGVDDATEPLTLLRQDISCLNRERLNVL